MKWLKANILIVCITPEQNLIYCLQQNESDIIKKFQARDLIAFLVNLVSFYNNEVKSFQL